MNKSKKKKESKPIRLSPGVSYFPKGSIDKYGKSVLKKITGNKEIKAIEDLLDTEDD